MLALQDRVRLREHFIGPPSVGEAAMGDWYLSPRAGVRVAPTALYLPQDINTGDGSWAAHAGSVGELTKQAGTPTYDVRSPFDGGSLLDEGVTGDGATWWQGASGPTTGTYDLIVALAMRWTLDAAAPRLFAGTRATLKGWSVYSNTGSAIVRLYLDGAAAITVDSPALASGQVVVIVCCINRDEGSANGAFTFADGIAGAGVDASAAAASIADEDNLTIGANGVGSFPFENTIYAVGEWLAADIFSAGATGAAEMLAIAKDLTYRMSGFLPQKAVVGLPTVTRATEGGHIVERSSTRRIWFLGNGLQPVDDVGLRIEGASQNKCLQSRAFATTWGKLDNGDTVTNNDATGPDGTTSASSLVADATDGDHGVEQDITVTAVKWCFSVWAKKGDKDWLYLSDETVANATAYFDLATPAVGTVGAGCTAGVEDDDDDWIRCWIVFTGTAAAHTFYIQTADADTDKSVQGDGSTKNTYLSDAQCEIGSYPSAPIRTAAAAVTRNALDVNRDVANIPQGAITLERAFTLPDHTPDAARTIFSLSDGTTDHHITASVAADGSIDVDSNEDGGNAGHVDIAGDYADGEEHLLRIAIGNGKLFARIDGGAWQTDATASLPAGWTSWKIGRRYDDTLYLQGHDVPSKEKVWKGLRLT
jgi:hypothetical protein